MVLSDINDSNFLRLVVFFTSRRRHTRWPRDWSSDVCSSDLEYLREWLPWLDNTKSVDDSLQFIKNNFQLYAERKGVTAGIFYNGSLAGVAGYNELDWVNKIDRKSVV